METGTEATTLIRRPNPLGALLGAAIGSAAAIGLMFFGRNAFQIRTLPERVTEWMLLFVPPEQFERAITTFGTEAKVYALYGAVAVLTVLLIAVGTVAIRWARHPVVLWLAGAAVWLLGMAVVMPVTGGGLFGTELPQDAVLVNALYLSVALIYVVCLLGAWTFLTRPAVPAADPTAPPSPSRRALLGTLAATGASFLALWLVRDRIGGQSDLPLAAIEPPATPEPAANAGSSPTSDARPAVPTAGGIGSSAAGPSTPIAQDTPAAAPPPAAVTPAAEASPAAPAQAAAGSPTAPAQAAAPSPTAPAQAAAAPAPPTATVDPIPQPPPPRQLKREHDGASTAVPRKNGELATIVTPNDQFYITTKNPVSDPVVDGATWRMVLDGEFNRPVQLDYRTLRRLPQVEFHRTLECISNFVDKPELAPFGNNLISNAVWKGARLADVLNLAGGLKPTGRWLTLVTADEFNAVIPASAANDPECILAYEMNGEVLPREHGYPTRLLIPGRYGVKNAKWIISIRAQEKETLDWYGQRGWSKDGFAKTMSRIDVPGAGAVLPAGPRTIAGIAYGSNRGIQKVEFSADGGATWDTAEIAQQPKPGKETWVIWQGMFTMPASGTATLRVRAIDGQGELQIEAFSLPQPNGATGWHTIEVKAPGGA